MSHSETTKCDFFGKRILEILVLEMVQPSVVVFTKTDAYGYAESERIAIVINMPIMNRLIVTNDPL